RPFAALPGNSPAVSLNSTFSLVLARQGGTGKRWDRPPVLASKPDQVLYCRTLGARTAVTRLAVDPAWIGRILSTAVRLGVSRLTAVSSVRKVIARVRRQLARTSTAEPRFELRVAVKHGDSMRCATLYGLRRWTPLLGGERTFMHLISAPRSSLILLTSIRVLETRGFATF